MPNSSLEGTNHTLFQAKMVEIDRLDTLFQTKTAKKKTFWRDTYHKIPKISPWAYIFQRPFLRGLFLEGLIFGGAYLRREICVSKSIGLAL